MKRLSLLSLMVLGFFGFVGSVSALDVCTEEDLSKFRAEAINVNIYYEESSKTITGEEYGDTYEYEVDYLKVLIYNLTENLVVSVKNLETGSDREYDSTSAVDGVITIDVDDVDTLQEYEFVIRPNYVDCSDDELSTKRLSLPRLNEYSNLALCDDTEDFYLCQAFVSVNKTYNEFYDERMDYINGDVDKDGEIIDDESDDDSKEASYIPYIIGGVVLLGVVGIVIFVIYKRKKRIL